MSLSAQLAKIEPVLQITWLTKSLLQANRTGEIKRRVETGPIYVVYFRRSERVYCINATFSAVNDCASAVASS